MKSLISQKIKKSFFDFTDSNKSIDEKIEALEYFGLEQSLANIGNLSLDKDALQFITDSEFKTELTDIINSVGKAYVNLSSENIAIKNKADVAKAYIHQQIEKAILSMENFDAYLYKMYEPVNEFKYYLAFDNQEELIKLNGEDRVKAAFAMSPGFDYNTILVRLLGWNNKAHTSDLLLEEIRKGTEAKKIVTELLPIIDDNLYSSYSQTIKSAEKLDFYRKLFGNNFKENETGIHSFSKQVYLELTAKEKMDLHRIFIKNLIDLNSITLAASFDKAILDEHNEFSALEQESYYTLKEKKSMSTALIARKGWDTLLAIYQYESEINKRMTEELENELSDIKEYKQDNFFKIFPFKKGETNQQVYETGKMIYPKGVDMRNYRSVSPTTYFLMKDGKLSSQYKNTRGAALLDEFGNDDLEEGDYLGYSEVNSFSALTSPDDFLEDDTIKHIRASVNKRTHETAKKNGTFFKKDNTLPVEENDELDEWFTVGAVKEYVLGIREELNKHQLLSQLLEIGLGKETLITVENVELPRFKKNQRKHYAIASPSIYGEERKFVYNALGMLAKPSEFYYKVLGLSANATQDEIKKAYRKIAMQTHADRNPENPMQLTQKYINATEAYHFLMKNLDVSNKAAQLFNPYLGKVGTAIKELKERTVNPDISI